jgi:hypothetical protein
VREDDFPSDPESAIRKGFLAAERAFTDLAMHRKNGVPILIDKSGSCAVVVIIVN